MDILLIENEDATKKDITKSLSGWGHVVASVGTGRGALIKLDHKRFDLALIDIDIVRPDFEVHELISEFKKIQHDLLIVTMTDHNTRELEMEIRRQGIICYMIKPYNSKVMKEILEHNSKKMRKEVKGEWLN